MAIRVRDLLDAGQWVQTSREETLDVTGRNAVRPEKDRHQRRVLLAKAALRLGEALGDAELAAVDVRDVRVVAIAGTIL